jgi:hypothetical protein
MKHIKTITVTKADAFANLFNAVWRAWQDFLYEKKNDIAV